MYKLTLTLQDRRAIDWVGHRYTHGHDFWKLLWFECHIQGNTEDGLEWDGKEDITFLIPESIAWRARALLEEDGMACFPNDLCQKLQEFIDKIV